MTLRPFDQLVLSCVGLGNLLFLNASVQGLTVSIPIVHFQHCAPRFGCDVDMRHLLVGDQVLPQPLPCPMVASLGIIGVVALDRSTVLTTSWEPTQHLQANQRCTFSCIHANPYKSQSVALKDDVILTITGAQGLPLKAIRWELVKD